MVGMAVAETSRHVRPSQQSGLKSGGADDGRLVTIFEPTAGAERLQDRDRG